MLAMRWSGKFFAWGFIGLMIQLSPSAFADSYLPANQPLSIQLCDPGAVGIPYTHYFHYYLLGTVSGSGSPGFSWSVNGYSVPPGIPQSQVGVTADLPAGTACTTANIVTSGIPSTATVDQINFGTCYRYPTPTCYPLVSYTFITPIAPSLTISPSGPISFINQIPRPTAETVTLHPNIATVTVSGSCIPQYGAVATVTPSSQITDDSGQAHFNIVTSVGSPVPGQTPAATCNFSTPGGTNVASVPVTGTLFQPTIGVQPSSIVNPGNPTVVATITPAYPGVRLDGTCTSSIATVSIAPTTPIDAQGHAVTNSQGQHTFTISAQNLISPNPNLSVVPSASCKIQVFGGTYSANVFFTTGNSCAFGLQPNPSACGNPN